jgi:two-component system, cell cycle sensor histidine kinase and response regulator CckA
VAHDFNNLLTSILGNASLALTEGPEQHCERLETVITAAERAADLTRQLLAYAGKAEFMVEDVSLSFLVRETMELLRVTVPKTIELAADLREELPTIRTDRSQIQQVLMNLVINAAEAIGYRAGLIRIRTAVERIESARRTPFGTEIGPGQYIMLEVADDGCGMDENVRARIFDPFYTTKFTGRGLGLAAVSGVVRSCAGTIEIESSPGVGTTFRVLFPAAARACAERARPSTPIAEGSATVLVVEDEAPVRDFLKAALTKHGYTVLEAADGREALEMVGRKPRPDLVVLDIVMPVMAGNQFLDALRALHPAMRVLLTSGWSQEEARRMCATHPGIDFIQKPYRIDQIISKIGMVLR